MYTVLLALVVGEFPASLPENTDPVAFGGRQVVRTKTVVRGGGGAAVAAQVNVNTGFTGVHSVNRSFVNVNRSFGYGYGGAIRSFGYGASYGYGGVLAAPAYAYGGYAASYGPAYEAYAAPCAPVVAGLAAPQFAGVAGGVPSNLNINNTVGGSDQLRSIQQQLDAIQGQMQQMQQALRGPVK